MAAFEIELDFVYEPRTPDDSLENQLGVYLFQNGWTNAMTAKVVEESGPAGGHPVVRFETDDEDVFRELREVYGLDVDEAGRHETHLPTSAGGGEYICSGCGIDQTEEALRGFVENAKDGISKAETSPFGSRLYNAGIVEAGIWVRHAAETARFLIVRQDEAEKEKVS